MDHSAANILSELYRDSFDRIRERERQRDRLFLIVVALLGLLGVELQYSRLFLGLAPELHIVGVKFTLSQIPLPVLLSTTWTFLAILVLRYYQVTLDVEKKFDNLHEQEMALSTCLGLNWVFDRERAGYLTDKGKAFRWLAWRFYTVGFPALVVVVVVCTLFNEIIHGAIPHAHILYDVVLGAATVLFVALYVSAAWPKKRPKRSNAHSQENEGKESAR